MIEFLLGVFRSNFDDISNHSLVHISFLQGIILKLLRVLQPDVHHGISLRLIVETLLPDFIPIALSNYRTEVINGLVRLEDIWRRH